MSFHGQSAHMCAASFCAENNFHSPQRTSQINNTAANENLILYECCIFFSAYTVNISFYDDFDTSAMVKANTASCNSKILCKREPTRNSMIKNS